jgi:hypothetical protein
MSERSPFADEATKISNIEAEAKIHEEMNRLRGRLCGLIESWGLDEKREQACKQTLKSITYDSEADLVDLINE